VTPSFNQAPFIERTLRSVLCQDYPHIQYIVMDAASTDGTVDLLRKYEAVIDVLVSAKDDGQSDALNRGFQHARGDILGYLNADDCLASASTISQVVRCFEEHRWADAIYGQRYYIGEQGEFTLIYPYRPFSRERLYLTDYIPQEAAFWTRRIYDKAGGYVNTAFHFAMDYELWLRFLRVGANFLAVPDYWGLFRSYAGQKSQALWRTLGVAECSRLQREHLGREVGEPGMWNVFMEHMYGAPPESHPESCHLFYLCWEAVVQHHKQTLGGARLDGWVDHAPVNAVRAKNLRAARAA